MPVFWWFFAAGTIITIFLAWIVYRRYRLHNLLIRQPGSRVGRMQWMDMGPTPLGEKGYTPQGMTCVDARIVFANSWKNTRSRVYEIFPDRMKIDRTFDMPHEAVHTSGLAWDGQYLWAVDYISNRAYCIDLEPSLTTGSARVVGTFVTTLRGTSACCFVPWEDEQLLAISDYRRTQQTIFVRHEKAMKEGTAARSIAFAYRNDGFSQGLEFANGFLYEAENKLGINVLNKIELDALRSTRDVRTATVMQYPTPSKGVEDLAWDGSALWTSDESVFRFFKQVPDSLGRQPTTDVI